MKEKKVVRSGAPFVMAGTSVLLYVLLFGAGTLMDYLLSAAVGALAFMAGIRDNNRASGEAPQQIHGEPS